VWKVITLLVLVYFAWWSLRRNLHRKSRQWQGEHVPEEKGIRPVTWVSAALAVFYGGYLLLYLMRGGEPAF
jgi:hypothetical protein